MKRPHLLDQGAGASLVEPVDRNVWLQDRGQIGVAPRRGRQAPPAPGGARAIRQAVMGLHDPSRMERAIRARQAGGRLARRHHEQAGTRLGQPVGGVHFERAEGPAGVGQQVAEATEVFAAVGGQQADDVLDHDQARRPALGVELLDLPPEPPEGSRTARRKTPARAREAEVLAGRRGPGEVGAATRKGRRRQAPDVRESQMVVTEVGSIGRRLHRIYVVGEDRAPAVEAQARETAAGEELQYRGRLRGGHAPRLSDSA